jgi:hypothetical protein
MDGSLFAGLREALLGQRAAIVERLAAVDQAEAALARLRDVFAIEGAARGAAEAPGRADPAFRALHHRPTHHRLPTGLI